MRKPTIWDSDQVSHKPCCTSTEDGKRLEILDLEIRGIVLQCICIVKTKVLISFAVTVKLTCAFVFAYADLVGFPHGAAHFLILEGTISFERYLHN